MKIFDSIRINGKKLYIPKIKTRIIFMHQLIMSTACSLVMEMHLKDLLGSIVRVGYRIPFPDFYLVLHGLRCRKRTIMD